MKVKNWRAGFGAHSHLVDRDPGKHKGFLMPESFPTGGQGHYHAQISQARKIAKLSSNEQNQYWRHRDFKAAIASDSKRKQLVKITLPQVPPPKSK
jgi:hypothetical protein